MRMAGSKVIYPAHYSFNWVGVLKKPTPNGGVVVVGGHRGGTSLFYVELLKKYGKPVSDYYHFGQHRLEILGFIGACRDRRSCLVFSKFHSGFSIKSGCWVSL